MKNKSFKLLPFAFSTAIAATASYALIPPKNTEKHYINSELATPAITQEPSSEPEFFSINHEIKKNESLSIIFSELELSQTDLHYIVHTNKLGKQFTTIAPGKILTANIDFDGKLQQLVYQKNPIETLQATRVNDAFDVKIINKPIVKKIASIQTTINSSLFLDGKDAGLSDKLIMEMADLFAWDIDFALNLREGDQFTIVYEKLFVNNEEIDSGDIISAEFVNRGDTYTAVRFIDEQRNKSYFTPEGQSMRKAFLRTPVDFARISSHYNLKRKHPVLNKIRAHKGVDYAAKTGTRIKTTGDGIITYRGRKGGYGRVVIVQHGKKYSTLYAHLSKFKKGQQVGNSVKQGQVIGYVGKSGLATGPHLHYEFLVNGKHTNPLTVRLPNTQPIKKTLLAEFKKQSRPAINLLNKAKANKILAQSEL